MMKFIAEKVVFQGESGYMLKQFCGEKEVASQFVGEEYFGDFCKTAAIEADMISFAGGEEDE